MFIESLEHARDVLTVFWTETSASKPLWGVLEFAAAFNLEFDANFFQGFAKEHDPGSQSHSRNLSLRERHQTITGTAQI